jgi:hypothetical protein
MTHTFRFELMLAAFVLLVPAKTQAQVALRPWTQVPGTVAGQKLGAEVMGIAPTNNLPYKASISSFGNTGLYTLQTQTDTGAREVFFGSNMLTGDLNNDGCIDIVVRRGGTSSTVDTVAVYWGTPTGIDTLNSLRILGENPGDAFQPACIGDVNNDGKVDLIVSAADFPHPFGRGKVYIYLNPLTTRPPDTTMLGDTTDSGLGISCSVGDLNGDGFKDLVIRGWNQLGPTQQRYDYINIYWGIGTDTLNLILGRQFRGYNLNSRALACFDANGDGIADLLWTNRDSLDWIYVHYGGAAFDTIPSLRLRDPQVALFGNVVINAGDMDGDGYKDIAVGAYYSISPGYVFVYAGGPRIDEYLDAAAGLGAQSWFGRSVSSVGDVNGDGPADIIVGAPNYEFGNQKGYWTILLGDSTITSVAEKQYLPHVLRLFECYPNPFNPRTTIRYELSQRAEILLELFDVLGRCVRKLDQGEHETGTHEKALDATGLASGVYFYRLTAKTQDGTIYSDTKKLTIIK